jgi:hypothetical protein
MMMMGIFVAATLMFAGGSAQMPNELLGMLPTDAYWKHEGIDPTSENLLALLEEPAEPENVDALLKQLGDESFRKRKAAQEKLIQAGPAILPKVRPLTKHSDPEVAARARDIIDSLTAGAARSRVRRLMAIRTLGDRRQAAARDALRKLQAGKEPFVAEYARRALAQIDGKAYKRPGLPEGVAAADVARLPEGLGLIAQLDLTGGNRVIGLAEMIKGLDEGLANNEMALDRTVGELAGVLHEIGNLRIDLVTLGVSEEVDSDTGFAVIYFRGLYDPDLLIEALKRSNAEAKLRDISGKRILEVDGESQLWAASRNLLVLIAGAKPDQIPTEEVIKLVEGKAKASRGKKLAALLDDCDSDQPFWVVARMSESYRKGGEFLASVESLMLVAGPVEKGTRITLTGSAQDAESARRGLEALNDHLGQAGQMAKSMVGAIPGLEFLPDLIGSIKTTRDDATIKADVLVPAEKAKDLLVMPLMFWGVRAAPG